MSNCTGYQFQTTLNLCGQGPFGNGNSSDLLVILRGFTLNGSTTIVGWDGTELVIDLLTDFTNGQLQTFSPNETCDITAATLTLIPDGDDSNTGVAMFEVTIANCDGGTTTSPVVDGTSTTGTTPAPVLYINDNCGSPGPHIITEMIPFTLADGGCE